RSGERTEGRKGADGPAAIPFPSFRPSIAVSLLLVTACQPQARRLLVLDLALSDPVVVSGTAEPWRDAGYTVEYRQFYPHLAVTGQHSFGRAPPGLAARAGAGVAAATRIGDGLVVVISRHALGALGPQFRPTTAPLLQPGALARTHDFLTALARWTRRPAEW